MALISEISIGRLHNLGNYEHIRYEVKLYITGDENPGVVINRVEGLLAALRPVPRDFEYEQAILVLSNPELVARETSRNVETYKRRIEKYNNAIKRRERALVLFGAMNGVSQHTDAKDNWEDDDFWNDEDYGN